MTAAWASGTPSPRSRPGRTGHGTALVSGARRQCAAGSDPRQTSSSWAGSTMTDQALRVLLEGRPTPGDPHGYPGVGQDAFETANRRPRRGHRQAMKKGDAWLADRVLFRRPAPTSAAARSSRSADERPVERPHWLEQTASATDARVRRSSERGQGVPPRSSAIRKS